MINGMLPVNRDGFISEIVWKSMCYRQPASLATCVLAYKFSFTLVFTFQLANTSMVILVVSEENSSSRTHEGFAIYLWQIP